MWIYGVSAILMFSGAALMFIAALGVLRMPDLMTRMHSATKAGALGVGLLLLSVVLYHGTLEVAAIALATILFIFATAPVGAQAIGRAAYCSGVPLWKETFVDELRTCFIDVEEDESEA